MTTSLLISIVVVNNVYAEVLDPLNLVYTKDCLVKDGLVPKDWVLIREDTLRSIYKDAEIKVIAEDALKQSQSSINDLAKLLTVANRSKWDTDQEVYKLQIQNFELLNPSWYESPIFWGPVGFVAGFVATVTGVVILSTYLR